MAAISQTTFRMHFLDRYIWIVINISLKCVLNGQINNIPSLVQIMAWRRPGDKPLSEPMMVTLGTHICVTRRQWVNVFPKSSTFKQSIGLNTSAESFALVYFLMQCFLKLCHNQRVVIHYSNFTWASCHLKSLATRQFAQQPVQTNNKEITKARIIASLWESTDKRLIPSTKDQ